MSSPPSAAIAISRAPRIRNCPTWQVSTYAMNKFNAAHTTLATGLDSPNGHGKGLPETPLVK